LEIAGRMIVAVEEKDCDYWLRRELTGLKCGRATLWKGMNGMGIQNKKEIKSYTWKIKSK
jgi:hypothetical protein